LWSPCGPIPPLPSLPVPLFLASYTLYIPSVLLLSPPISPLATTSTVYFPILLYSPSSTHPPHKYAQAVAALQRRRSNYAHKHLSDGEKKRRERAARDIQRCVRGLFARERVNAKRAEVRLAGRYTVVCCMCRSVCVFVCVSVCVFS